MANLKHVGRVKNTGRRCVVIFREIYDDKGHVVDDQNCLIVETDSLPDAEHQDILRIVESEPAQATGDVFNIFARQRLGNGTPALSWLAQTNRLRKVPTNKIEMTPDSRTVLALDKLNKIVKMQKTGASEADIKRVLQDDTDMPPREASLMAESAQDFKEPTNESEPVQEPASQPGTEGVLDDSSIAQNYVNQAEMFEKQAIELREQAYKLDPSLKPTRTRKEPPKKEPANKKA